MAIGTFGTNIIFETNESKILTFDNFQRQLNSNWANHEIIGQKSRSEFLGTTLEQISFDINLNITFGIKPKDIIDIFEQKLNNGEAEFLVIGGNIIGNYPWKITSMTETWNTVLNNGEIVSASLNLTLEEYV